MRILVACEESQIVCKAFRSKVHEAYSSDILPTRGNPEWHIQGDVRGILAREAFLNATLGYGFYDLLIAFVPCDHLAVSGARWFPEKRSDGRQQKAIEFFLQIANAPIERIAIENPIGIMSTLYRKPDQIIQPWQFGHGETKATCLWLKNLPKLIPTNIVNGREARVHKMAPGPNRSRDRAVTYYGIAEAMATQWSNL